MAPRSSRSAGAARPGAAVRAAAAVGLARVLRERCDADDALAAAEREVAANAIARYSARSCSAHCAGITGSNGRARKLLRGR